mmetsp:Transcript_24153/g.57403  ORF Transcript_24153/g.57403 Transcript_24153/m.57403 type:complete len:321 (-) Transcript_24153:2508-3470(-)
MAGASCAGPLAPVRLSLMSRCTRSWWTTRAWEMAVAPWAQMLLSRRLRKRSCRTLGSVVASAVAPSGPIRFPSRSSLVMQELCSKKAASTMPPSTSQGSHASFPIVSRDPRVKVPVLRIVGVPEPAEARPLKEELKPVRLITLRVRGPLAAARELRELMSSISWLRARSTWMGPRILRNLSSLLRARSWPSWWARSTPMLDLERSTRTKCMFIAKIGSSSRIPSGPTPCDSVVRLFPAPIRSALREKVRPSMASAARILTTFPSKPLMVTYFTGAVPAVREPCRFALIASHATDACSRLSVGCSSTSVSLPSATASHGKE